METLTKAVDSEIKSADAGGFSAYASRFLNIDRQGDMILPGAYNKALPEFLDDGGVIVADHINKTMAVAATLTDAREDRNGLLVQGQFSATETGQRIRQLLKEKAVSKMSISFTAASRKIKEADILELWNRYNYTPSATQRKLAKSGANLISEVNEIFEVSFVPIPANREAGVLSVKSLETPSEVVTPQIDLIKLFEQAKIADKILGR